MKVILPVYETFVNLHEVILEVSGGKEGIRDKSVLLAAVERPKTYLSYHPECDIHTVCAVLLDSIARNHGFVEGNKRTGLMTLLYTYRVNDFYLDFGLFMNKEFEEFALWVVLDKPEISEIANRSKELVEKHKLKGIDKFLKDIRPWLKAEEY